MNATKHHDLWRAVRHLAQLWSKATTVQTMIASLPDNAPAGSCGMNAATVPSLLQGMRAGAGTFFARPLLLGTRVAYLHQEPMMRGPGRHVDDETLNMWLLHALAVEHAHRVTLAWLRSRLPGYPMLRVPQLAVETHLTTGDYTASISWTRDEMGARHQFDGTPRDVPRSLGASPTQGQELDEAARELATALMTTPEWLAFAEARSRLTKDHHAELMNAKRQAARRLEAVALMSATIFERDARRRYEMARALETLDATAHDYCEAFDAINNLIEQACGDAFGQLVAYGDPDLVKSTRIDLPHDGTVQLRIEDPWAHLPGSLIQVDDALLPDALEVRATHGVLGDLLQLNPSTLTLRTLSGSSVWFA